MSALQLIAWPHHAGLRDVSMGLGAGVLAADEELRAGIANPYAAPGGPSLEVLLAGVDAVLDRFEVTAAALTAYDPRVDGDGAIPDAARRIVARIARRLTCAGR
jgi:hypothetical protein